MIGGLLLDPIDRVFQCNDMERMMSFQVFFAERDTAFTTTARGQTVGVLYFSSNFTESLDARRRYGVNTDEGEIETGEIPVWLDMSSKI